MPLDDDRLATAAAFVTALFDLSRHSPRAWRRADAVGRSAGIAGQQLEQADRRRRAGRPGRPTGGRRRPGAAHRTRSGADRGQRLTALADEQALVRRRLARPPKEVRAAPHRRQTECGA